MKNRMKVDFSDRSGIITGAGAGMGKDIALRLADDGASVILADVNAEYAIEVQKIILSRGGKVCAVKADVSAETNVKEMVDACVAHYTKIDFLVSNAGTVGPYEFEDTTAEDWDGVFAVNARGGFLCAKYVLPHMKRRKSGRIVFNGSTNGGKPGSYVIAYRASKAALIMLACSLALHAAPYGITVTAVCPGVTMTPMQRSLTEDLLKEKGISFEEYVQERRKRVPMGRFTEVHDVTDTVEFLISENAAFITGQAIYVNGGEW